MTITLQSMISDVRSILRDPSGASAHYTDLQILNGFVDGFRRLYSVRPESRYDGMSVSDVVFPTAENDLKAFTVDIEPRWRLGVIYFSVARCYEADITDTVNMQLAASMKQQADMVFAQ